MKAKINTILLWIAAKKVAAVREPHVHFVHASIAIAVEVVASFVLPWYVAALIAQIVFGVIEFWFDKHYENQSFTSNWYDFEDYWLGSSLFIIAHLLWSLYK